MDSKSKKSAAQLCSLLPEYVYDKSTPHKITNGVLAHLFYNECNKKFPETISKIKELTGLNIKNGWMRSKLCSLHDSISKKLRHLNSGNAWDSLLKELDKEYVIPVELPTALASSHLEFPPSTDTPSTVNSSTATPMSTATPTSTVTLSTATPTSTVTSSTATPTSTVTSSTATPSTSMSSTTPNNIRILRKDCKGCVSGKLRIAKLEIEKNNLKRKLSDLKDSFVNDTLEIKRKLVEKSQKIKTVKKQFNRKATIEGSLRTKNSGLKSQVKNLTQRLDRLEKSDNAVELKKLKIKLSNSERLLGKKRKELDNLTSEVRALKMENKELKDANDCQC